MSRYYVQLVLRYLCSKGRKKGVRYSQVKTSGLSHGGRCALFFVKTTHSEHKWLFNWIFVLPEDKQENYDQQDKSSWKVFADKQWALVGWLIWIGSIFFVDISQTFGACVLVGGSHENAGNKAKFAGTIIFVVKFSQHSWDANRFVPEGEGHLKRWWRT